MPNLRLGLSELHACGIVHTDTRPANTVYMKRERRYKLIDFNRATEIGGTCAFAGRSRYLKVAPGTCRSRGCWPVLVQHAK